MVKEKTIQVEELKIEDFEIVERIDDDSELDAFIEQLNFDLVGENYTAEIEYFLEKNKFIGSDRLTSFNQDGHTPLTTAVMQGMDLPFIKALICAGAYINQPYFCHKKAMFTPLQLAVVKDAPQLALLLLQAGADFNQVLFHQLEGAKRLTDIIEGNEHWADVKDYLVLQGAYDGSDPYYLPQPPIKNLVFEGAGIKGAAYVGVLEELQRRDILSGVDNVAGTSAGGIISLLLCLGYKISELTEIFNSLDLTTFMDGGGFLDKLHGFMWTNHHGIYEGSIFYDWAKEKINKRLNNPMATFSDLYNKCQEENSPFKNLFLTGTNLSTNSAELFCYYLTPNMPLVDAVRITMSYPTAFKSFPKIDENGDVHYYADGGVITNCPALLFEHSQYIADGYSFTESGANPCTLLIKIDTAKECRELFWYRPVFKHINGFGIYEYLCNLFYSATSYSHEHYVIQKKYATNTIQIYDEGITSFELITPEQQQQLRAAGREATKIYFDMYRNDNTSYYAIEGDNAGHAVRPEIKRTTQLNGLLNLHEKLSDEIKILRDNPDALIKLRAARKRLNDIERFIKKEKLIS